MINAETAEKLSKSFQRFIGGELNVILNVIEKSANRGERSCIISYHVSSSFLKELEDLGFEIDVLEIEIDGRIRRQKYITVISW